ncbi:hypothetical protein ACQ4PT_029028 [Festuca glaucescens]
MGGIGPPCGHPWKPGGPEYCCCVEEAGGGRGAVAAAAIGAAVAGVGRGGKPAMGDGGVWGDPRTTAAKEGRNAADAGDARGGDAVAGVGVAQVAVETWRLCRESPAAVEWTLPADLLLEIIARSDTSTLVRCAATSRVLRSDILDPSFINRDTRRKGGGIVPQRFLACLNTYDDTNPAPAPPPLSLVRSITATAVLFVDDYMSPYMSHFVDDLLGERIPVMSCGGLVLLRHRYASEKLSSMCVYDPFTGHRTFFSDPLGLYSDKSRRYHLLTSANGIRCSLLLAANLDGTNSRHTIQVQTFISTFGIWALA